MNFKRLYADEYKEGFTKGFPPYLNNAVSKWIYEYVISRTPQPSVFNTMYTTIDNSFNAKINAALRQNLGNSLEEHLQTISNSPKLMAEYINYLLQKYPDHRLAKDLEEILDYANSEYTVHFQINGQGSGQKLPDPGWQKVDISLQFRTSGAAEAQIKKLSDNYRMQQAWNDLYDVSKQNFSSVVQKSLDQLAGVIRDRFYPDEEKTNLSDYANRFEKNIDQLNLPNKDRIDWPAMVRSMANFVDKRGVHNSGTDSDPGYQEAHDVFHICSALIVVLREDK